MTEIETVREIESQYEGDFESRIHDLLARITESDPSDAENLVMVGSFYLQEFATQHVVDLDRLRQEVIDLWRNADVQ